MTESIQEYFERHPEAKDGVMKAYYAYHAQHFRLEPKGHNFTNSMTWSRCVWCGRSRTEVRHDDLPGQCQNRPETPEIVDVVFAEEQKACALLLKAEWQVSKLIAKMGMSGETLAILHHTHGFDLETVASVVDIPESILSDYRVAMEKERERSISSQRKMVVEPSHTTVNSSSGSSSVV